MMKDCEPYSVLLPFRVKAIRDSLRHDFMRAFEHSDVLLGPTTPTTAYKLGAWASKGAQSYEDDVFCVPASLAGLPAISLPCGLTSNRYIYMCVCV